MNRHIYFEIVFAIGAITLGLYLLIGSSSISLGTGYDHIGPRFFPYLISAGLLTSAGLMLVEVFQAIRPSCNAPIELIPFITLLIALVSCVLLLEQLGFILAVTLLFTMVARAFKSTRFIYDGVIGFVLAVIVYYIFTVGLGLVLPRGILAGII